MFSKLRSIMKSEIHFKDILIWFVISYIIVLFIMIIILQQDISIEMLIEVFGFAFIFVLMMSGTKIYSLFIEGYYESLIQRFKK